MRLSFSSGENEQRVLLKRCGCHSTGHPTRLTNPETVRRISPPCPNTRCPPVSYRRNSTSGIRCPIRSASANDASGSSELPDPDPPDQQFKQEDARHPDGTEDEPESEVYPPLSIDVKAEIPEPATVEGSPGDIDAPDHHHQL